MSETGNSGGQRGGAYSTPGKQLGGMTALWVWTLSLLLGAAFPGTILAQQATGTAQGYAEAAEGEGLFRQHCASCHGWQRYGGYAPPLIPQTLKRKKDAQLERVIREGRPQTQMPPFGQVLAPRQLRALIRTLRTPVGPLQWGLGEIQASRQVPEEPQPATPYRPPRHRERVVLVVERGLGRVVVLDGDTLERLDEFAVGRIHGGPKFTGDYATVFSSTRDGTVVRYNLLSGRLEARVKAAVNTRNIAVSPDGAFVAAVNQLPQNLVILDGALHPQKVLPLPGIPSAVYRMPGSSQFVLTLRNLPRMLFVSYPGLRMHEVELPQPFEDFTFVPGRRQVLASTRRGKQILLYDLDARRVINALDTTGLPHLFSATFFMRQGRLHAALNHIGVPTLTVLDMDSFRMVKQFKLKGAGYFVRTHPGSPYLWADTNTEALHLVDKASLTLRPEPLVPQPGKKAMHVEFTADGSRAMVSIWHPQGALVVYDAASLREVRRLPFNMPIGKYNARNKTHFPLQ